MVGLFCADKRRSFISFLFFVSTDKKKERKKERKREREREREIKEREGD